MAIGVEVSKSTLDARLGRMALDLKSAFDDARDIKAYTDQYTAQQLADNHAPLTLAEANTLKSAIADAVQLANLWSGAASLANAYDHRTFIKALYGLGIE